MKKKKDNIIYFASLIAKYDLINSLIDMRKKLINDDNLVNDVINRKYVNKIVNVLHDYPGITHSKLAEVINIDKTKLTHTIHRMYDLEIFLEKVKKSR
ncbi:MAG: hypothetical protein L6U99_05970 [Clostridium sp.]|nr:MAG: hypothetical protein L6U99_05970 [Clostridium sp.]